MRSTGTDSRLDDFKVGVDSRLDKLSQRVSEMDARLTGRIDKLQHTMVQGFIASPSRCSRASSGWRG